MFTPLRYLNISEEETENKVSDEAAALQERQNETKPRSSSSLNPASPQSGKYNIVDN
jgi:hypothetical protein